MTQAQALDLLKLGSNVFLTGAAGSGKTYVLNQYISYLRENGVTVAVTASTGIAATHLGGQTIHSWSGIGIKDAFTEYDLEQLASKRKKLVTAIRETKVLIIDEVSMLHAHQLEMVDFVLRGIGDFTKPFGGKQVILCGDFFQLPPVARGGVARFVFESDAWQKGEFIVCYLTEQHRQNEDALLTILNDIRQGKAGEHTKVPLRTRYQQQPAPQVVPTRLYTHNADVDRINHEELETLDEDEEVFVMMTRGPKKLLEGMKAACLAPEYLRLKRGAAVMFVKNHPEGEYVNGTLGVVEGFDPKSKNPLVRTKDGSSIYVELDEWRLEEEGETRALLLQYPLRLAWAITVHKSQGMTLDAALMDLSKSFEPGMGYVALSRVRTLDGLCLVGGGLNEMSLRVNDRVLAYDQTLRALSEEAAVALDGLDPKEITSSQRVVLKSRFAATFKKAEAKAPVAKQSTHLVTGDLIAAGKTPAEVAKERGLTMATIFGHLEKLKAIESLPDIEHLRPDQNVLEEILGTFDKLEDVKLAPVYEALAGKYTYDQLRLARLFYEVGE